MKVGSVEWALFHVNKILEQGDELSCLSSYVSLIRQCQKIGYIADLEWYTGYPKTTEYGTYIEYFKATITTKGESELALAALEDL
jgi:hypothetical protein